MPDARTKSLSELQTWYDKLPLFSGAPARGTIAAALWVLERLRSDFDLEMESHRAAGGAQIKGISPVNVAAILGRYGETRQFLKEGGRTNRGGPGAIEAMLRAIEAAQISALPHDQRIEILDHLQRFLVDKVREYHGRESIKPIYNATETTRQFIAEILCKANQVRKRGPVAQHLVRGSLI
jgi:hypothetical protein